MRDGALRVALALEAAWALFLAYEVHRLDVSRSFLSVPVASTVLVFADQWAAPAVAIVVVVWLGDVAVVRLRA